MRASARMVLLAALSALVACASAPDTPREYLDEQTAATITVAADAWVFTREASLAENVERDFLHIYAIDVNRMGEHLQYLAVLQSAPPEGVADGRQSRPQLHLHAADESLQFDALDTEPKALGIAAPIADSYTLTSRWWYFPADKQTLRRLSQIPAAKAEMLFPAQRLSYVVWRDGRSELAELTDVLP